jgi:hypothetical protein
MRTVRVWVETILVETRGFNGAIAPIASGGLQAISSLTVARLIQEFFERAVRESVVVDLAPHLSALVYQEFWDGLDNRSTELILPMRNPEKTALKSRP